MDAALFAAIEENEVAAFLSLGRVLRAEEEERDGTWRMVSTVPVAMFNRVMRSRLVPGSAEADETIAWAIRPYRERGVPFSWTLWPAARPADVGPLLERHGLARSGAPPAMALDLASERESPVPPDLVVRPVDDLAAMEAFRAVVIAAFSVESPSAANAAWMDGYRRVGFPEPDPWRHFVGWSGGVPVACASAFCCGGVAGVYTVGTVPAARGRGFGRALTEAAVRHGREQGYRTAVLWASPAGRPVYARMGFRELGVLTVYSGTPGRPTP